MKNFFSSLSPVHEDFEEQEPVLVESKDDPYLPEPPKTVPYKGPEKTVIAGGVEIVGPVTATGDVEIYGTLRGDLCSSGDVLLAGTMEGNIKAKEVRFSKANLKGDIEATGMVILEDSSNIEGNVITKDFILDGKLQGNVKAEGAVVLKRMAMLSGNVEAGTIEVSRGATINGSVTIRG